VYAPATMYTDKPRPAVHPPPHRQSPFADQPPSLRLAAASLPTQPRAGAAPYRDFSSRCSLRRASSPYPQPCQRSPRLRAGRAVSLFPAGRGRQTAGWNGCLVLPGNLGRPGEPCGDSAATHERGAGEALLGRCSAGWPRGTPPPVGTGRGRGSYRLGAAPGLAPARALRRPSSGRALARGLTAAEAAATVIKTLIQPGGLTRPRSAGCDLSVRPVLSREIWDGAPGGGRIIRQGERRNSLARAVFHGQRDQLRRHYQVGQENPADVARLTPLGHPTINLQGRYRTTSRHPLTGL